MTTWLDHLRIRTKLGLLVLFFLGALGVFGLGLRLTSRTLEARLGEAHRQETLHRQAQDEARATQVHFKIQVQEWKNLLLRGHDERERARYLLAMDAEAREVGRHLTLLETHLQAGGQALPRELADLRAGLEDVSRGYLEALALRRGGRAWDPRALDGQVRGRDREPTLALDRLVETLDRGAEARDAASREETRQAFARMNRNLGALLVVVLSLGALLAGAIALRLQEALSQLLHAHQELERGILSARLDPGGDDELALLSHSFNGMAARLQQGHLELAEARDRAEEASRVKSAFVASMSHELRTPLNAILGYTQLLEGSPGLPEEDRGDLGKIRRAGDHLLELINDILSIAKIEADHLDLNLAPFSPTRLLQELEELLGPKARAKGLDFKVRWEGAMPAAVLGDAVRVRQILLNLLSNAVKFTKAGHVHLLFMYAGGRASFHVVDTGPGISPEDQARIYHPFQQAEAGRRSTEGTGLGLAITQGLIRIMGGQLRMVSRLGEGTTFTVELTLPEEEAILDVIPSGRVTRLAPDQRPWTLLVVDDRIENRELLAKLFTRVGFRVLLADSGEEGLALWEKERPDLIWMDIRMPGMDGYEALHHLRDLESRVGCARTPVIAITASVMDQDDVSMRAAGFDGFVTKPFREADLYEAMARLLPVRFETA